MKRAVILIIDSLGVGAMQDAPEYGDSLECNTLSNLARHNGGLNAPNLQKMGLGNITEVTGMAATEHPVASFGKMQEASKGKDSTTGHWEIAGLVSAAGFKTYPDGFPEELMNRFLTEIGCSGYYGNIPASGTAIIDEFHAQHKATGNPIIYTSADSVFQIAADVSVVPIEKLYEWCEIARKLLDEGYNCSRVIARPYEDKNGELKRLGALRRDYSVPPPKGSIMDKIKEQGGRVVAIGKTEDIFVGAGITHSIHTGTNKEGLEQTIAAMQGSVDYEKDALNGNTVNNPSVELIFTNLVDTDMIYGHRRDPKGYGASLEEIDTYMDKIMSLTTKDDLLIITADHGCDPTAPGSDHTREMVPLLVYNPELPAEHIGTKESFTYVAKMLSDWYGIQADPTWTN